jgi:hypothetical protein
MAGVPEILEMSPVGFQYCGEIELKSLDKQKLVKYANKYPGTVRNALTNSLAFEHFAA